MQRKGRRYGEALGRWWRFLPHRPMFWGAAVCTAGGVLSGAAGGSPYAGWMAQRFAAYLPSVTMMRAAWLLWYALLGAGLARLLSYRGDFSTAERCLRTALPYMSMLYLGYLWYPIFFGKGWLFLSALLCGTVLFLCVLSVCRALCVNRGIAWLLIAHGAWLVWLTTENVRLLFR